MSEMEQERPLVSVGIMTYNHAKYIVKALDSVIMQEVNFKYEIVIAEDCSTDGTREIVIEYQKKYPDIIRLLLHEKNLGMKENSNILRRSCRGIYRANLEGDDYWIDPCKLQKQVDFLENNKDYVAVGGNFTCVDDYGKPTAFPWGDITYTYCFDDEYTIEHFKRWLLFAHTSTMMFRNFFYDCGEEINKRFDEVNMLGDRRICLFLVLKGRVRHIDETWIVRRVLRKSKTSMTNAVRTSNYLWTNYGWMLEAERYSREQFSYKLDLGEKKAQRWLGSIKVFVRSPNKENLDAVKYIFLHSNRKMLYIGKAFIKSITKTNSLFKEIGVKKGVVRILKKGKFVLNSTKNGLSSTPVRKDSAAKSVLESYSQGNNIR